jgi:type III restriction enzyme
MRGPDVHGQARVIAEVRALVDRWRGFALGAAAEPWPVEAPRYEPAGDGEGAVSDTTMGLLQHWFRHEPHVLGRPPAAFKYWPHQRRLVETFIYLYEVRGIRRTEDLYKITGVEPLGPQHDPWAKLGGQLATGSGKTKMMSLIVAWAYLNAVCERESRLGFGRHSLLIAPGLFVRDRLLQDFAPAGDGVSVFSSDPVLPPGFERIWRLNVYEPANCPQKLDPDEGALVVTNYHQLLRTREMPESTFRRWEQRQVELLFEGQEPQRLEAIQTPLLDRFARSRGLLVLNDEAHHVWDETGHARFEQKAKDRAKLAGDDEETEMAWIRSIRRLNGSDTAPGRVALQVDLSATLFEEAGAMQKAGKGRGAKTEFKQAELFRHAVVHYGLAEAIKDGIVKKPILERVEVKNKKTGEVEELIREGQPNAWEKYRNILVTGIERWKKVGEQLADEGDARKPILFVLCNDRNEAGEVANFLTYGEASREDLSHRTPSGWKDAKGGKPLFIEKGADGVVRSTVVEIHIGEKEERNEEEWEHVRRAVNAVDQDAIPDPGGKLDESGRPLLVPNPYNVVVSVMMLKEGWDVRNVKVIVPLRPCDSRTLTEQTLGRGLRKMHPPLIDDEGAASFRSEELYVIEHPSFKAVLDQIRDIIEERKSDEIEHAREYVPILQKADLREREERGVRLVRFEGLVEVVPDWRKDFDVDRLPALVPKMTWREEIPETEIHTFLKAALAQAEEEGQTFVLADDPSYRDFDHIIEAAYAIPLLRDLRASYQHKNAVKAVVREFLERKTFALPLGIPLSFDKVIEGGHAKIALGNLARSEIIATVRKALLRALHEAITAQRRASEAQLSERNAKDLASYQALKANVIECPRRSTFERAAVANEDERRVALLIDEAKDVTGWLYNHRSGVGYSIPYDWQGHTAHYFPDFIVRARLGEVFHNVIIEVKGRYDDRDKEKARRGRRYCELLTEYDREPWHYLMLIENEPAGRQDIRWWEGVSSREIGHLLARHETLPLFPEEEAMPRAAAGLVVVDAVPAEEQYRDAVPVHDLAASAGGFSEGQEPKPIGWARVRSRRLLDRRMFVARAKGRSMEPGIPDGSWMLLRVYPAGEAPAAVALDGRRVVVELRGDADPETGGAYTLKRWRVTKTGPGGGASEIELRPDNPSFAPRRLKPADGEIRVIAEFLEVVG